MFFLSTDLRTFEFAMTHCDFFTKNGKIKYLIKNQIAMDLLKEVLSRWFKAEYIAF